MIPEHRPTPPGEFIKEDILHELGLSQAQLATLLGVSRRTINQLVNGKRKITADLALRLGKFTNTSPELWMNLQASLDLWDALHSVEKKPIDNIQPYAVALAT